MAAPEQIWNEQDLPYNSRSVTVDTDEDTIEYDRTKINGTSAAGLLAKTVDEDSTHELVGAGERPRGIIRASGGKGRGSLIVEGKGLSAPRGDTSADAAVTVVNAQNLNSSPLTIADDLGNDDSSVLTVTPTAAQNGGTLTIEGLNDDDDQISEDFVFVNGTDTAQVSTNIFKRVTNVPVTGFTAGAVTITTAAVEGIAAGLDITGDTKTIGSTTYKGYAKGIAAGHANGMGVYITRVTADRIYFDM